MRMRLVHGRWAVRLGALAFSVAALACQSDRIVYRNQQSVITPPAGAANYVGYTDATAKQTACGNCHVDQQTGWTQTAHAKAWADLQASGVAPSAQGSCIGCHSVSSKGNASALDSAGYAGTHDARYQDVQCENCHGAGLNHVNAPSLGNRLLASIAVDTGTKDVNGCGECHTGTHEPFVDEWRKSAHGNSVEAPALSNYVSGTNKTCVGCHTAQGALATWGVNTNYQEKDSLTTHALAVTCTVCHDPHGSSNPAQLRFALNTRDTSSNLCMRCHQRRAVPDPTNTSGPHSPEGPTLLGQAGWRPPNWTGPTTLVATHGSTANANLCATCHVSRFTVNDPKTGSFQFQATGHLFVAIPCLDSKGLPTTSNTCDVTQRTFAACTGSGCHATTDVARSAYIAANQRIALLDSTLSQMLAKVPASELTLSSKIFTARGAKYNLQLAEEPGSVFHNPFLIEALLTSSIQQVQTDYKITPNPDVSLNNVLGHSRTP